MKACVYIAKDLERRGVTHVYELVGGMITFLIDALNTSSSIQVVSMHHEQGAAFAAEGYARIKGTPGVALATSGPGATNLLTAVGSCYFDSIPAVFITGQVNRSELKGARAIRQLGFQETDIVSMAAPITKAAWQVTEVESLPRMLNAAFALAMAGRPGPVLLDIPMDVQRGELDDRLLSVMDHATSGAQVEGLDSFWREYSAALSEAKRPLILCGGGVNSARAVPEVRNLTAALEVPVVCSLLGVDVLEAENPHRLGFLGSYGNRWVNIALSECDLLLVLGSRLDVRQTGADVESFKSTRAIYHVDCEAGELNNRVTGCRTLVCDLKQFLRHACASKPVTPRWADWQRHLLQQREAWPDYNENPGLEGINPNRLMRAISHHCAAAAAYAVDVGQHQMWAAQSLSLLPHQRFLTSGGMGAMGCALPMAIGATGAAAGKPVVVIAGDGGFQLNVQELQTIVTGHLPIKIIVINNHCHGMVRQFQESYFGGRYHSTVWGYTAPNFMAIAQAYGIRANRLSAPGETDAMLAWLWADQSASLLEVQVALEANAYPKIAFGRPISDMEPQVSPTAMEST